MKQKRTSGWQKIACLAIICARRPFLKILPFIFLVTLPGSTTAGPALPAGLLIGQSNGPGPGVQSGWSTRHVHTAFLASIGGPWFSPKGGCTAEIIKDIKAAKTSVLVQAYSFASGPIADALIAAKASGIDVKVIFDKSWRDEMQRNHYANALVVEDRVIANCPTLIDGKHAIAHNKVMVIDGRVVLTGSFNYTNQAETSNAENIVRITDAKIAKLYSDNWGVHAAHSVAATATPAPSPAAGSRRSEVRKEQRKTPNAEHRTSNAELRKADEPLEGFEAWLTRLPKAARAFKDADREYWHEWWSANFDPDFAWTNTDPKRVHTNSRPLLRSERNAKPEAALKVWYGEKKTPNIEHRTRLRLATARQAPNTELKKISENETLTLDTEWQRRNDTSAGWWLRHGFGLTWNNNGELMPKSERSRNPKDWNYGNDERDRRFLGWWKQLVLVWPKGSSIKGGEELFYQYFQGGDSPRDTVAKYRRDYGWNGRDDP